uniref:Uncharacterized protein n=1 Tax=Aegilops tauschii subsp. strangulata TaxID=200361 RepID=A0A453DMD8_AEGTS
MALIKNNTNALCLLILLMSTTLFPCEATGRNKGTTALIDVCKPDRLCENPIGYNVTLCKVSCEWSGYSFDNSYCEEGKCCAAHPKELNEVPKCHAWKIW